MQNLDFKKKDIEVEEELFEKKKEISRRGRRTRMGNKEVKAINVHYTHA
jgi:hypothetical protein